MRRTTFDNFFDEIGFAEGESRTGTRRDQSRPGIRLPCESEPDVMKVALGEQKKYRPQPRNNLRGAHKNMVGGAPAASNVGVMDLRFGQAATLLDIAPRVR